MSREYFDLAVIVPLEEEVLEFMQVFPHRVNRCTSTSLRYIVDAGVPDVSILVVQQEDMGRTNAIRAASNVLQEFDVGLLVCLGIAASLSKDLALGDVCYTGTLIDTSDNSKALDGDKGGLDIQLAPTQYSTPLDVTASMNFIRTQPELQPRYRSWQEAQAGMATQLVPGEYIGRDGKPEKVEKPRSVSGSIVCGLVSQSSKYNDRLKGLSRKVLAVETESGGVFEVARSNSIPAIAIRGIADYAVGKGRLEQESNGSFRKLAALNASTFLAAQFANQNFLRTLFNRRQEVAGISQTHLPFAPPKSDDLSSVISDIGKDIDDRLRELSPEFRLQPKGYRLPVPRARPLNAQGGLAGEMRSDPIEVRDILDRSNIALLNVARTYPDQSLAWVVASDLLTAEFGEKQVVPIVINGDLLRPPKSTIAGLANYDIDQLASTEGVQPVLIVENPPLHSKTKTAFLVDQVKSFPGAKIIVITRSEVNIVTESEILSALSADLYGLCEISFAEIAHFIQKNFSMSGSEAEVVALKLRQTFDHFELSAHPSYFAGIPRETLSSLLQANRRAELIQLAVDGFLTFMVADDKADVNLSRTTRFHFLRKLSAELNLQKRRFTQAELVEFVREFADQFDYDIDPLAFIQGFVEKGILHFEAQAVRISLPFIESYALATELRERPKEALSYFRIGELDFDDLTFDIYAELGPSDELVESYISKLAECVDRFGLPDDVSNVLLTNEISAPLLLRPERIQQFQKKIRQAIDDVRDNRDESREKQRLLDVADRVRDSTAKQRESASSRADERDKERDRELDEAIHAWAVCTILLGSGAERLPAEAKRRIAKLLIEFSAFMADDWTRFNAELSFDDMKRDLTSQETLDSLREHDPDAPPDKELRKLIGDLVDIMQVTVIQEPFKRVIGYLCEQAHHKVLARSLETLSLDERVENVAFGAWLSDIDPKRGKAALKDALRNLPESPFLRLSVASHLLTRVYWSHWKKDDRLLLLDAAEEAIKPLQVSFNKSEIQRQIERMDKADSDAEDVGLPD